MLKRLFCALTLAVVPACAGSHQTKVVSASDSAAYAAHYVDALDAATKRLQTDQQRAHELATTLPTRARELAPHVDRELALRVVDEADRAGRSASYVRAQNDDRTLRAFWEDERAGLGARVSSAAQKQATDAGCTQTFESNGDVQHALRDGVDRQLERRLRAASEAQRTLELSKARLAPGRLVALQRLADDLSSASYLGNVGIDEDTRELDRYLRERGDVEKTLDRMLDDERALQRAPQKPAEQRASQDRVVQLEKLRASLPARETAANDALGDSERAVRLAQDEYDNTIELIKATFRDGGPNQTEVRSVKP